MRLVTFESSGRTAVGGFIANDERIVDLTASVPQDAAMKSMQDLIDAGEGAWDRARELCERAKADRLATLEACHVRLLAPVPRPIQMRDFGCFSEHFHNCMDVRLRRRAALSTDPEAAYRTLCATRPSLPPDFLTRPRFYTCNRLSVVGPDSVVPWPHISDDLDFELEFGIFIGRAARNVDETQASAHIFGYTLFNDLTMRDVQSAEDRTGGKNKDFDCGNVMGPCIVTADELADPYRLRALARVNDEVWCDNSTQTMDRSFEQVISYMSQSQTLHPGEFFASGTVGRGSGLEHDRHLCAGDRIELEIEGIGVLRTTIGERNVKEMNQ